MNIFNKLFVNINVYKCIWDIIFNVKEHIMCWINDNLISNGRYARMPLCFYMTTSVEYADNADLNCEKNERKSNLHLGRCFSMKKNKIK